MPKHVSRKTSNWKLNLHLRCKSMCIDVESWLSPRSCTVMILSFSLWEKRNYTEVFGNNVFKRKLEQDNKKYVKKSVFSFLISHYYGHQSEIIVRASHVAITKKITHNFDKKTWKKNATWKAYFQIMYLNDCSFNEVISISDYKPICRMICG
jgi:hypothetical protein